VVVVVVMSVVQTGGMAGYGGQLSNGYPQQSSSSGVTVDQLKPIVLNQVNSFICKSGCLWKESVVDVSSANHYYY